MPRAISIMNSPNRMRDDLGAGEAEDPQARQLPGPLLQANARAIVDDANGDDDRECGEDAGVTRTRPAILSRNDASV